MKSSIKKTIYINQDLINSILIKHFEKQNLEITKLEYDVSDRNGLYGVNLHLKDEEIEVGA